ncbi:hypothetical protein LMG31884_47350 (plasmid) [Xanthomonas hydrangeae]|uniref:lytic transglycosylase domain-containing protein n=1 Tax=Xanthomonas hydrangeae TaxID=2775159 RepID=UPI00196278CF|nr:hypothetical protein LMG31884_47350 [Xanthomonas hydrangeae]CAD7741158.1 hypothetical protein LMG31884_47350 [Xanthomonas hydrangeae]CAD7747950.1 hypothetical protein LMG31887_46460 [Xanthomonas hydrangeae]CAD7747951.1 hypothetical protein LMG31887_46460 [Xanthomonas hydrangeae]CAD7748172.1 hypothetical protein LMG31885_45030 [Xanthomonas hydrangeae]
MIGLFSALRRGAIPSLGIAATLTASPAYAAQPSAVVDLQQRAACVSAAAERYAVSAPLVYAIIRTEGGKTGRTSGRNRNGSVDLGLMQVNEIHLPELARLRITREMVIYNECLNIFVGTFILSRELNNNKADFWTNVGAYNSRTACEKFYALGKDCPNIEYQKKVISHLTDILQGH